MTGRCRDWGVVVRKTTFQTGRVQVPTKTKLYNVYPITIIVEEFHLPDDVMADLYRPGFV